MNKIVLFSLLICLGFVGCSSEPKTEAATVENTETTKTTTNIDFVAAAKDVCNCMAPVVEIMDQIKSLSQEGKLDDLKKMGEASQPILNEADVCFKNLEVKYGKIEGIKDAAFSQALVANCPGVANLVSKAKELGTIK